MTKIPGTVEMQTDDVHALIDSLARSPVATTVRITVGGEQSAPGPTIAKTIPRAPRTPQAPSAAPVKPVARRAPVASGKEPAADKAQRIHAAVGAGAATAAEIDRATSLTKNARRVLVEQMKQGKYGDALRLYKAGDRGSSVWGRTQAEAEERYAKRYGGAVDVPPPVAPAGKSKATPPFNRSRGERAPRRTVEREPGGGE